VAAFAASKSSQLGTSLRSLQQRSAALGRRDPQALRQEARALGDEVLSLERYIHLNQVGGPHARLARLQAGAGDRSLPTAQAGD
jgi:hypothetical protein